MHEAVFGWVLEVLASRGLNDVKTLGVDATTQEANAALRSIVRRDTGESYESFLKELARKSGVDEPSRADMVKVDKKRPKKGSNKEWVNPKPDAEIMKMKGGGTHLAHKAEHAVDMNGEGAVIAVTLHGGAKGDTKSLPDTLEKAPSNLQELADNAECCERIHEQAGREVVADKGYHSNETLVALLEEEYRSYISEPERSGRKWKDKQDEQAATYANVAFAGIEVSDSYAVAASYSNDLSRTTSKREACDERICEDMTIYSSASSRTWPDSISGF